MDGHIQHIEGFLRAVQKRLNRHLGYTILLRALAVSGLVLVIIGGGYILQGLRIPRVWYALGLGGALLGAGIGWWFSRLSLEAAAREADTHFRLHDAVRSFYGFLCAGKQEGFYALQADQTETMLDSVSVEEIRYQWPKWTTVLALLLMMSSGMMALKADRPEVVAQRELEIETLLDTELINKQLEEMLEQLEERVEDEELAELMELDKIRQWMDQLRELPDLHEAMSQYAQLERNLNELQGRLQQRQTEELLDRMGEDLYQQDQTQTLGHQLTQRQYDAAAQQMLNYQIPNQAGLQEQEQALDRLREASQRMAEQAQRSQRSKQLSRQSQSGKNSQQQDKQGRSQDIGQQAKDLDQAAEALAKALKQAQQGKELKGELQEGDLKACQLCTGKVNDKLKEMSKALMLLASKRKAQSMLESLNQCLGQAQCGLGQGNQPGMMPGNGLNPGGQQAGLGTSHRINSDPRKDPMGTNPLQLEGIKGTGPSVRRVESASDGSGSQTDVSTRRLQTFQRQMESFVRREDVPDAVKSGVKAYFESIHQINKNTADSGE